jgi:hypothetical protein
MQVSSKIFVLIVNYISSRSATFGLVVKDSVASRQIPLPFEHGIRLAHQQHLVQFGFGPATERSQLGSKPGPTTFLPVCEAWSSRMVALPNAQLLAPDQEFEILLVIAAAPSGKKVD